MRILVVKNRLISTGVRLPSSFVEQVDVFAASRGISRTEAMRISAMLGLPLLETGVSPDIRRVILLLEYLNLGMTLLLEKEHSHLLDRMAELAEENVERFHG